MPKRSPTGALLAVALAVSGCAESYRADSLLAPPVCVEANGGRIATSASRRLGCVDVRVGAVRSPLAPATSAAFEFAFGNRCDAPVRIDLTQVRVTARLASGQGVALTAFDPRGELHPAMLGGRRAGRESIEFDRPAGAGPEGAPGAGEAVVSVCVDITALTGGAIGHQEICFHPSGAPAVAGPG